MAATEITECFPQIESIENQNLRTQVVDLWETSLANSDYTTFEDVPWLPHVEELAHISLVRHTNQVTDCAIAIAEAIRNNTSIDTDVVIAGALTHDICKFYEYSGNEWTEIRAMLEHPHYNVHVLAEGEMPIHVQHIALSHSGNSSVEPQTIEALIVSEADNLAARSMWWEETGRLDGDS